MQSMTHATNYHAVITSQGVDRVLKYHVALFFEGRQIATNSTDTRFGARRWARRTARKHRRHQPYREEIAIG